MTYQRAAELVGSEKRAVATMKMKCWVKPTLRQRSAARIIMKEGK